SENNSTRQALVPANEILLLTQEAKAMTKCFHPNQTFGNYITSFNVDAPPSLARQRQLDSVLVAEERRQVEILKEGNPLSFFDIKVVDKQSESFCDTDYVLFVFRDVKNEERPEVGFVAKKSPKFQIIQSVRSRFAAREAIERLDEDNNNPCWQYYILPINNIRNKFAVVSVVLSQLEVINSQYAEPFLAVHALFASEIEAGTYAMKLKPSQSLKSAMLCVFPIGKWIHLERAHDWCVQVELNKREKRAPSISEVAPLSPSGRSRRLSLVSEPPKPIWQLEREEAKRLHNFICARMGAPAVDKTKDRIEESGGFTPQPIVSLEDKLDTLHSYLEATSAFTARTGHGGVAILKYRQVKRFGSIMRSRIAGALPHGNGSNHSNSSPSPNTSFSNVVPGY
ncbi:Hypothetical protein PHPALM_7365, partial [Phytophthora palmivora]